MARTDAVIGCSLRKRHFSWPVAGSMADRYPETSSVSTATPAPQYGMLSLNSRRRRVAVAPTSRTGAQKTRLWAVARVRPFLGAGRAGPEVDGLPLLSGRHRGVTLPLESISPQVMRSTNGQETGP